MGNDKSNIDSILTYIIIKSLVTPVVQTKAYKLGLVDNNGRQIKEPETEEEKEAISVLQQFIFKLKRLLGSRLLNLKRFLYVATLSNDFYNKLIVKGSVEQRAEIKRMEKGVKALQEKYDKSLEEFLMGLLNEELSEEDINEL